MVLHTYAQRQLQCIADSCSYPPYCELKVTNAFVWGIPSVKVVPEGHPDGMLLEIVRKRFIKKIKGTEFGKNYLSVCPDLRFHYQSYQHQVRLTYFKLYVTEYLNSKVHAVEYLKSNPVLAYEIFPDTFITFDDEGAEIKSRLGPCWREVRWNVSNAQLSPHRLLEKLNRSKSTYPVVIPVPPSALVAVFRRANRLRRLKRMKSVKLFIEKWRGALWKPYGIMSMKALKESQIWVTTTNATESNLTGLYR